MHCSEVLDLPLDAMHVCDKIGFDGRARSRGFLSTKQPGTSTFDYMRCVADYSSRELTYEADHLNAFQGVLNAFKRAACPMYNFWGIPIPVKDRFLPYRAPVSIQEMERSRSARFASNLFWQSQSHTQRCLARMDNDIPSWSWARWEGPISEDLSYSKDCLLDACVWLEVEGSCNKFISLDGVDLESSPRPLEDEYTSKIQIEAWTMDVDLVDVPFNLVQKARFKRRNQAGVQLPKGPHVRFSMGAQGTFYSELYDYDPHRKDFDDCTFLSFLQKEYRGDQQGLDAKAMLLKKIGLVPRFRPTHTTLDWRLALALRTRLLRPPSRLLRGIPSPYTIVALHATAPRQEQAVTQAMLGIY
ncbi:hypothetical protein K491DRAFT_684759 [Lophiostoma macrostomum CBS 122681]|uniref:Heterokaryon incompatibility domain-containing protein n=1 Tax=Lophiostoma macrostomum CBS 122681 TaxID=1314788 RepID=A0A6A6SQA2_9PLEO|nr:hypothetical protein K491DRAFT_684759 [Lophiostoma macrostomum CBS 122681]